MTHIPDHELLMEADGELPSAHAAEVRRHVAACADCRARQTLMMNTLGAAIADQLGQELPPIDGARTLLQSRMKPSGGQRYIAVMAAAAALAVMAVQFWPQPSHADAMPMPELTPGATRAMSRDAMCAVNAESDRPAIPHAVATEVFRKYGIHNPQPRMYEVDYLIPPGLGGIADEKNLWPQPYNAGTWNARVKDALEDRLRTMVCGGELELSRAQNDLAVDWVRAYKEYFHTQTPLPDHVAFVKDQPWQ